MKNFRDINELDEWLEPVDYIGFWNAIEPYRVFTLEVRDHCNRLIMRGEVTAETILKGIKEVARQGLLARFKLGYRHQNWPWDESLSAIHSDIEAFDIRTSARCDLTSGR